MYDVFFICYDETNREENWKRVLEFHPQAKRIALVTGISKSHMVCNHLSSTPYFWTVDGDNWLLQPLEAGDTRDDLVFFKAIDSIDADISTAGAVKLWKKDAIINPNMSKGDFCKHATKSCTTDNKILSVHKYDSTPYEAWRHTFRHMVKCYSGILIPEALTVSLRNVEKHKDLNEYSYRGYLDAKQYVEECAGDFSKINLINDYAWLKTKFLTRSDQV